MSITRTPKIANQNKNKNIRYNNEKKYARLPKTSMFFLFAITPKHYRSINDNISK